MRRPAPRRSTSTSRPARRVWRSRGTPPPHSSRRSSAPESPELRCPRRSRAGPPIPRAPSVRTRMRYPAARWTRHREDRRRPRSPRYRRTRLPPAPRTRPRQRGLHPVCAPDRARESVGPRRRYVVVSADERRAGAVRGKGGVVKSHDGINARTAPLPMRRTVSMRGSESTHDGAVASSRRCVSRLGDRVGTLEAWK